jgi:hypothetical protein
MATLSLIVRADSLGLCHASNQAIWEGLEAGMATCATVLVTGPWLAEAAALIHDHPEWEIGLLLNLTCDTDGCRWGPAAGAALVPSLVDATGMFGRRLSPAASAAEIAREFDAQLGRAHAWKLTPAFLEYEGEPHPGVDAGLHRLSERLGVPGRMAGWGLRPVVPSQDNRTPDPAAALSSLPPGDHLWVVRPAQAAPETWALWPEEEQARRHADALAVRSPEIRTLLNSRGIELISFRQHVEARLGTEADRE